MSVNFDMMEALKKAMAERQGKPTPGPWRTELGDRAAYHTHERRLILGGPDGLTTIAKMPEGTDGVSEANARLMAAAPLMLEALQSVMEDWQIASETWRDSDAGPATVPGEPRELEETSLETISLVMEALKAAVR